MWQFLSAIAAGYLLGGGLLYACAPTPVEPVPCEWQWVQNNLPNSGIDSVQICVGMR